MNKKIYITPNTQFFKFSFARHFMMLSEGEQTEIIVNDSGEEVDAGNSLARKKSIWDDDEE